MIHPNKKRLRRSMMFLNCQKPGLIKDPYIYKPDSIMLDLEDAVAENQKDAARYSLYHALQEIDYQLDEAIGFLYVREYKDALPKIEVLIGLSENIPQEYSLHIGNIF